MAKQKSGLGRGLNALFDSAEPTPAAQPASEKPSSSNTQQPNSKQSNTLESQNETTPAVTLSEQGNTSSQSAVSGAVSPSECSKQTEDSALSQSGMTSAQKKASAVRAANQTVQEAKSHKQQAQNITFSEEDLENAKVVEREARRPVTTTPQPVPQKKPTKRKNTVPLDQPLPSKPAQSMRSTNGGRSTNVGTAASVQSSHSVSQSTSHTPRSASTLENQAAAVKASTSQAHAAAQNVKQTPASTIVQGNEDTTDGVTLELALDSIKPNPNQPRTSFKKDELEELAQSIKRDGLLQPILVRKVGDHYEIIAGERRYQACCLLGLKTIPVRFWEADSDKALELALIENIQRSDLNPIEEAYGYKRLMERKGMTQSEVAQTVSKGRSTVANALRLLDLPEQAQQLLFEEKITAGHARAILSIPSAEGRQTLTKKLMEEKLSVRETEAIARLLAGKENSKASGNKRTPAPASFKKAARGLTKLLSTPVRVKTVQGKNKIEIQFKDEDELQRIIEILSTADSTEAPAVEATAKATANE